MEALRKYIIIFLILIFGSLSLYYIFLTIKTPSIFNIIILLFCLFLFVIFNSILLVGSNFLTIFISHIFVAIILSAILFNFSLSANVILLVLILYLIFQVIGYIGIYYFEKDRLKINWLSIFKITWRNTSWFIICVLVAFVIVKFDINVFNDNVLINLIKKLEPIFVKFNLPNPSAKFNDFIKEGVEEKSFNTQIQSAQIEQLKKILGQEFEIPNNINVSEFGIEQFNKQFNLNLNGDETIAEMVVMYVKNFWNNSNDNIKLIFKLIVSIMIIGAFQPMLMILGNLMSIIAIPLFFILQKIRLYSKIEEQAIKEKIVI